MLRRVMDEGEATEWRAKVHGPNESQQPKTKNDLFVKAIDTTS